MSVEPFQVELAAHEKVIERGLKTFVEVGSALADIRDARLYREGYNSFEDYCLQRWGWSDSRARQLIGAAQTVTTVTELKAPAPATESQARELSGLEPEQAATVMRTASDTGEKVTAERIRDARAEVVGDRQPIAKVTETTKTETFVDTDTGEIIEPPVEEGEHPHAAAARARKEYYEQPFVVFTQKIAHSLHVNLKWIEERTVAGLFENFDSDRGPGDDIILSHIEGTADRMAAVAAAVKSEIAERRKADGLKVVR